MRKIAVIAILILFCCSLQAKVSLIVKLDKAVKGPVMKDLKTEDGKTIADDTLEIVWEPGPDGFFFNITNKTNTVLTVLWDECAFINEDKKSSKVAHGEIEKKSDLSAASTYRDVVAPIDYLYWSGKGWGVQPIFLAKLSDEEFAQIEKKDLIYKVILAFKTGVKKLNYTFTFKAFAE